MTTPRDALATALHADCLAEWERIAETDPTRQMTMHFYDAHLVRADETISALHAAGWTVARTEHARDGEALARLRESIPDGWSWGVFWASEMFRDGAAHPGQVSAWTEDSSDADRWTNLTKFGDTIAAAADACREAIEASR